MRRTHSWRVCLTLVVVLTLLLGGPFLTWAHVDPPTARALSQQVHPDILVVDSGPPSAQPVPSARLDALLAFTLFGLMAVAMARSRRQWRRGAALGLAFVLGVFMFGVAIHAVHHLSEPQKAAECLVFSASQHVTGTPADTCDLCVPALTVGETSSIGFDAPALTPYFHPAQPRAPPSFPA